MSPGHGARADKIPGHWVRSKFVSETEGGREPVSGEQVRKENWHKSLVQQAGREFRKLELPGCNQEQREKMVLFL